MLRIDVDARDGKKAYGIPKDNPFLTQKGFAPEVWAWGLRNPWRYTFDPRGRLIVADVGQNKWEEVSVVEAGKNHGWRVKDASHCYRPDHGCSSKGFTDPWLEYGRADGGSITGGYVYTGSQIPPLKGKYIFGDFVSGRLWAATLPKTGMESKTTREFSALGRWPISPSTFGRSPDGEVLVGDFTRGIVYRVAAP
jgi:glucose/arabinose dehydrogenase